MKRSKNTEVARCIRCSAGFDPDHRDVSDWLASTTWMHRTIAGTVGQTYRGFRADPWGNHMPAENVQRILHLLRNAREVGDHWQASCPAHDDQHGSLSVAEGQDGRVLIHCHAGCTKDQIRMALNLHWGAFFPPRRNNRDRRIGATYDYHAADGTLLYQVVRFVPKDFRQRAPDGNGGWNWKMTGVERVLYHLPELVAADPVEPVLVVEGEKDADNLRAIGFVATCNPGGAGKWSKVANDSVLAGRHVVIIADKDDAGRRHAQDVATRLRGRAASIRVLELPGDAVKDASDWISTGGTADQLRALIASAPSPAPTLPPTQPPPATTLTGEPAPGTIDPDTERLILSSDRTLPTAQSFVDEFFTHADGRTLQTYAGILMRWKNNHYVEMEDAALVNQVMPWLHKAVRMWYDAKTESWRAEDFPANPRTTAAAIDSVRAVTHLAADTEPPCWLSIDTPGPEQTAPPERPSAKDIIPCRSSLLHLPTMTHLPPTPAFFAINALDFDPDPNAREPETWINFLGQTLGADAQAWGLLQEWFGYCLTGDTSQQKMILLVGPKRSGKGTIARVLRQLVGTGNVAGPTTSSLAGQFGLQPLIGKSLAIVSDARFSGEHIQTVVERLLCISGEDTLTIDRKHTTSVTLKLPTRFVFLTNELPRLTDSSGALAGRFMMLRLTESFYGREDISLTERLTAELPGILNWAIDGWHRLKARGRFVQPESVEEAMRDIEELASPVSAFVRECCDLGPEHRVWVDDLYNAWKEWCEKDGRTSCSTRQVFGKDLRAAIPNVKRSEDPGYGKFYRGIGLNGRLL